MKEKAAAKGGSRKLSGSIQQGCNYIGKCFKGGSIAWLALIALVACSGQEGPVAQVSAVLKSVAKVSEAASDATSLLLSGGTELTISASSAVVKLSTQGYNLMETVWHGLDLLDIRYNSSSGKVVSADPEDLSLWLRSEASQSTTRAPSDILNQWSSMVSSVSLGMPLLHSRLEQFEEDGFLLVAEAKASLAPSGHCVLHYLLNRVVFTPRWANPLWQALELNLSGESKQIRVLLASVLASTNSSEGALDTTLAHGSLKASWRLVCRRVYGTIRELIVELCSLWGGGSFLGLCWAVSSWKTELRGILVNLCAKFKSYLVWGACAASRFCLSCMFVCGHLFGSLLSVKKFGKQQLAIFKIATLSSYRRLKEAFYSAMTGANEAEQASDPNARSGTSEVEGFTVVDNTAAADEPGVSSSALMM